MPEKSFVSTTQSTDPRLKGEIQSFGSLWQGGYYEGDPLDPMGRSEYNALGYMSALYATYLACIKPYITPETVALEIGPGRGAWTRCLVPAKEIWCLDALSAEHNGFWQYVGEAPHVKYFQVSDFACEMLPANHFDYLFSFGCLCHVSFEGTTAYMTNLREKLKSGAHCFLMVADYDKFNASFDALGRYSASRVFEIRRRLRPLRALWKMLGGEIQQPRMSRSEDDVPRPGRWYNAGIERTCAMLQDLGYRVLDSDMGVSHRDPLIHCVR
jgi:hypothetical protein